MSEALLGMQEYMTVTNCFPLLCCNERNRKVICNVINLWPSMITHTTENINVCVYFIRFISDVRTGAESVNI